MQNNLLEKLIQIAPNIVANQQQQPQYGNFVANMQADAIQKKANEAALNNKMAELQLEQPQVNQQVNNPSRLASAIESFKRGYNENVDNAFSPSNFNQNQFVETIPANTAKLQDYQNQLLGQGINENVVNAVAEGKNSGNKDIDNWIKANPDAFNPAVNTYEKTPMGKMGEAAGTLMRFANTPAGQALIQGGISALINNDWREGVKTGLKAGQDRATSNMYRRALKAEGIDTGETGFLGNLSSTDYNSFMNRADKNRDWDYKVKKFNADEAYREKDLERKLADDADKKKYRAEKLNIDRIKAANRGGGKGGGKTKLEDNPENNAIVLMEAPDGRVFRIKESEIGRYKKAGGKIVG